jgi:hypothetical protein
VTDFWIRDDQAFTRWDKLLLGGKVFPGVAQLEPMQQRAIGVAKRRGREPTLTDNGYDPGQLKASVRVWEESQWVELQDLVPQFSPRKNDTIRTPYEIYHPATELLGIDVVTITSISVKPPEAGVLVCEIAMIQWFPETRRSQRIGRGDGGVLDQNDFEVNAPNPEANL